MEHSRPLALAADRVAAALTRAREADEPSTSYAVALNETFEIARDFRRLLDFGGGVTLEEVLAVEGLWRAAARVVPTMVNAQILEVTEPEVQKADPGAPRAQLSAQVALRALGETLSIAYRAAAAHTELSWPSI
ncbi:MAG: hypothetical protein U1E65_14645 [Myxococcota bacterium]